MNQPELSISPETIHLFLSKTSFFADLPTEALRDITNGFELIYLHGNETLFNQHEMGDALYIVMFGFLQAEKEDLDGKKSIIGGIGAGDLVGEIGCLFDEPRTASIFAVRDSVLLKMTRNTFDQYLERYPNLMMGIARLCVKRLVDPKKNSQKSQVACFTLMPSGLFEQMDSFSQRFAEKLSQYGPTLLLTEEKFDNIHGIGSSNRPHDSATVLSWIQSLELKYSFIVYVASATPGWAERCIRQADKILLIGQYGQSPELSEIERFLFKESNAQRTTIDLVLLTDQSPRFAPGTSAWLEHRKITQCHKIRTSNTHDFSRLIRIITGNALGLVLSGGGAGALAHIGLLRALKEFHIDVDYIGGSSMGSIISGLHAMEYNPEEMTEVLEQVLADFTNHIDYTLPISALIKGQYLEYLLKKTCGDNTVIEDLWQPYFCVSTNLSNNEIRVDDSGPFWKAIRRSISLPAIFTPLHDEHNHIFVDGGVLNNLPVDIMSKRINGGKTFASCLSNRQTILKNCQYEKSTTSGWYLLYKYFLLPKFRPINQSNKKREDFISIATAIQDSMIVGSSRHQQEMLEAANYRIEMNLEQFDILDFKPIRQIIDSGYRQSIEYLNRLEDFK